MAIYSEPNFYSKYLLPQTASAQQAEFKFDSNQLILANPRLVNIGVSTPTGQVYYHPQCGVAGLIDAISLYSDGVLLEEIRPFNAWYTAQTLMSSNDEMTCKQRQEILNLNGWTMDNPSGLGGSELVVNTPLPLQSSVATTLNMSMGMLRLKEVFGFLNATNARGEKIAYLPTFTGCLGELRLVIEWNTQQGYAVPNQVGSVATPILVYDFHVDTSPDQSLVKAACKFYDVPVTYSVIDTDRGQYLPTVQVTNVNTTLVQNTQLVSRAFTNRKVNRILIAYQPSVRNPHNGFYGGSLAGWRKQEQIFLNNKALFGSKGIYTPAQRKTMLEKTWGDFTLPYGAADVGLTANYLSMTGNYVVNDILGAAHPMGDYMRQQLTGTLEYTGFPVNSVVSELAIQVSRTGVWDTATGTDSPYVQQTQALIFAETERIRTSNGQIVVVGRDMIKT
jgi:hypothetical protein